MSRAPDNHRGPRCPYCASPLQLVWVHGHAQCAACGINVMPCCGGEQSCPLPNVADNDTSGDT